jgi:hypothetical protein
MAQVIDRAGLPARSMTCPEKEKLGVSKGL